MRAPLTAEGAPVAELRVFILHVPDCPSAGRVRDEVDAALERVGATAVVEEIEGPYRSPTVLIAGVEVEGYPLGSDPACRIDVPTSVEITAAILAARRRGHPARVIGGSR